MIATGESRAPLGEVIFAIAVIVCLRPGNERFVRDLLDRGELDGSIVVSSIVALIVSVLLLRDGALRGWRPFSGTRSTAGIILLLTLLLALDFGSAVEGVAQADAFVFTQRQERAYRVLLDTATVAGPNRRIPGVTSMRNTGRASLAALRRFDRGAYDRFVGLYVRSGEDVMTFSGCVASHENVGHIVRAEHPLEVRDGESGSDAFKRHHGGGPWEIDIEHGGYSSMLLGPMPPQFEEECRSAEQTYDLTPTVFE